MSIDFIISLKHDYRGNEEISTSYCIRIIFLKTKKDEQLITNIIV